MSDLDDLAEIADNSTFGVSRRLSISGAPRTGPKPGPTCKSGHPRNAENTRTRKRGKGFVRVCRVCVRLRRIERMKQ
jgi:hypothetical protein